MSESSEFDRPGGLFSLTQIRHLMRVEFSRAQRYSYPLVVLSLGVDGLKNLRELHGYDVSDRVLASVAGLLDDCTRVCDHLGRLVDDRLLAVLPHTNAAGAEHLAERLLVESRELVFDTATEPLRVTLSIGVCCFEDGNAMFFDALLDGAQAAANAAHAAGGNRVVTMAPGGIA